MRLRDSRWRDAPSIGQLPVDHFLNQGAQGYASDSGAKEYSAPTVPGALYPRHFSIFRADSVSVTSTQFAGGDWRWSLSDRNGAIVVQAGGYRDEAHCREAVAMLQAHAARATVD